MLELKLPAVVAAGLLFVSAAFAAGPQLAVDRGLPQQNLNNVAGTSRSNVRWHSSDKGFLGDDFLIGRPGEQWVIDSIRTWAVPGLTEIDPDHLGDFYQDVRLYLGRSGQGVTPRQTADLTPGSEATSNLNVHISDATQSGASYYDNFGKALRIWQIDFTNLNMPVEGGSRYSFGVWGMGREIPGSEGDTYLWFNHASNAALSGAAQDNADGRMLLFDGSGQAQGVFDGAGHGWDKSSDINIQVFAHRVNTRSGGVATAAE